MEIGEWRVENEDEDGGWRMPCIIINEVIH